MRKSAIGSKHNSLPSKKKHNQNCPAGSSIGQQSASLQINLTKNPREAAFLAFFAAEKQLCFIHDWLEEWVQTAKPSSADFKLAQEIAFGTMRMKLTLDAFANQLSPSLKLKPKIKALLRTAIYQAKMMDKIPLYAIVDETTKLAKKHFSVATANFFNALLRKIETTHFQLPNDLSVRYSYPSFLVDRFVKQFGLEKTEEILKLGNTPPKLMARELLTQHFIEISSTEIKEYGSSSKYYIQNRTPFHLFQHLKESTSSNPQNILDLCAAPGGKLILAHEFFPKAELYANDVSEKKLKRLRENLDKYGIKAKISEGSGEEYSSQKLFDLIILDVPCSNTGVLNKRPEARWRIENLAALIEQAEKLLSHALSILQPNGRIWFMTCSILDEENNQFLEKMAAKLSLKIGAHKLILPDAFGNDGGFAAELKL